MKLTVTLALCLMALPALANSPTINTNAREIVAQQHAIRAEVQAGTGRYKDMPQNKRNDLLSRQDRVLRMLDGRELSTELSQSQQLELINELEAISALVNQAEDERMICERVRPMGSNRPTRVCKTVAQRRAEQSGVESAFGTRNQKCIAPCEAADGAW